MKKIISMILTVSIVMSASSVAFAQPKEKTAKPEKSTVTQKADSKTSATKGQEKNSKATEKKNAHLDKSKADLLKRCESVLAQINKLKSYIISEDGKFLVDFKDQATGDTALKSIEAAIAQVNSYKVRINEASSSKDLKDISKELQNNWMKNQTFVKRITGLTSTARLETAYDQAKEVVDKLGAGINGITTNAAITLDQVALKAEYDEIVANLEEAHEDYLQAVAMFSSVSDSSRADKDFKAAHAKLMDAKDGIHDALSATKKLLVKIKNAVKVDDEDDDDKDVDDDDDKDEDDEDDDATNTSGSGITTTNSAITTSSSVTL